MGSLHPTIPPVQDVPGMLAAGDTADPFLRGFLALHPLARSPSSCFPAPTMVGPQMAALGGLHPSPRSGKATWHWEAFKGKW